MNHTRSRAASWTVRILLLLAVSAAGASVYLRGPWKKQGAAAIPDAEARVGDFIDTVELRGEIAVRSASVITAPYNAGDLQILKLVPNGSRVRKGDVVVSSAPR